VGGKLDPHSRFDAAAESYDRFRPGYPREAIEWLIGGAGVSEGDAAIDLGAGTGLLSARLVELGLEVTAVEPSEQMRSRLSQRVPGARVLADRVEELSLGDGSFALATAGQAYHWFEPELALSKIHRVLRPGGHFAVAWIVPDTSHPVQAEIEQLSWRLLERSTHPGPLPGEPLGWERWFDDAGSAGFPFSREIAGRELPDYVSSFSVVAVLEPDERQELLDEAAGWAAPGDELELPYRAEIHLGRRHEA
jgi:SAM-dependent methyltransferase